MMKRWIGLLVCLAFGQVQAASFDCAKAGTKVEKLICANKELSKLDEALAKEYAAAQERFAHSVNAKDLPSGQKFWLRERDGCRDAACIRRAYERRLRVLMPPLPQSADPETGLTPFPHYGFCPEVVRDTYKGGCGENGKGYSACEAYLKHLNTLPNTPGCELPVPPGFKRPEWEAVNVLDHLDWAYWMEQGFGAPTPDNKLPSDFETWRKDFKAELQAGRIDPHMHKVRVSAPTPKFGDMPKSSASETNPSPQKQLVLLAYTRDRLACQDPNHRGKFADRWNKPGYLHVLLTENAKAPLQKIPGWLSVFQPELLLYAGKPYFVQTYSAGSPWAATSFHFEVLIQFPQDLDLSSSSICELQPYRRRDGVPQ